MEASATFYLFVIAGCALVAAALSMPWILKGVGPAAAVGSVAYAVFCFCIAFAAWTVVFSLLLRLAFWLAELHDERVLWPAQRRSMHQEVLELARPACTGDIEGLRQGLRHLQHASQTALQSALACGIAAEQPGVVDLVLDALATQERCDATLFVAGARHAGLLHDVVRRRIGSCAEPWDQGLSWLHVAHAPVASSLDIRTQGTIVHQWRLDDAGERRKLRDFVRTAPSSPADPMPLPTLAWEPRDPVPYAQQHALLYTLVASGAPLRQAGADRQEVLRLAMALDSPALFDVAADEAALDTPDADLQRNLPGHWQPRCGYGLRPMVWRALRQFRPSAPLAGRIPVPGEAETEASCQAMGKRIEPGETQPDLAIFQRYRPTALDLAWMDGGGRTLGHAASGEDIALLAWLGSQSHSWAWADQEGWGPLARAPHLSREGEQLLRGLPFARMKVLACPVTPAGARGRPLADAARAHPGGAALVKLLEDRGLARCR